MTQIDNTLYLDNREKRDIQILTDILYDDMEVERLDIGDALMRGVIFELKRPDDFVSSIFDKRLFTQISNMVDNYKHTFVLISGSFTETELLYNSRSKTPNFLGVIASCIARGCTPLFTGTIENSLKLIDLISAKVTDGKNRTRPVKTTSIKDAQMSIVCSLPGVSETRAKDLLTHFGSVEKILSASEKELCEVNRIGPKIAQKIRKLMTKKFI